MAHSSDEYAEQLAALLPRGTLWDSLRQVDTLSYALLLGLAEELARVDGRAEQLIAETDPREVLDLLTEWEAFVGLPDACSPLGVTLQQRREALHARLTAEGGQSRADFIALAERLGFAGATITEYEPHTVDADVDAPLYGDDWRLAWQLSAPQAELRAFTVMSTVDESLGEQAPTARLECAINRTKPAHTIALFEYL